MRRFLYFLLLSFPFFMDAEQTQLPKIIDYGKYPGIEGGYFTEVHPDAWNFGYYSFNYAPEVAPFFAYLKKTYNLPAVVETGTFLGGTTALFSLLFDRVYTIEIDESNYLKGMAQLQNLNNVHGYLGSSETILQNLLPDLRDTRLLFYLDAHWQTHWPLLQELEEIAKTHKDNCIIVIDDIKVPGRRDIPYDMWGPNECSLKYVEARLNQVFTSYSVHYLVPKSVKSRAKLIAIPNQWK